jgi:hypothetical protein
METLTKKLCSINSYEEMEKTLSLKETIKEAESILDTLKISHTTSINDFLSLYSIYKFPDSVIGDIDVGANNDILEHAKNVINTPYNNTEKLKSSIINFIYNFKKWKTEDKSILIYHLFEEYHKLSVDILNTNDNEKQIILKNCQRELLETAKMIGGKNLVDEIKGYRAIIASNINFQREYDKAYWATLKETYDNNEYEKCIEIILFIKNVLVSIGNNTQKIEESTEKIISHLEKTNSNFLYIKEWAVKVFDYIKTIHSPVHDMQLESFKRDIHIKEIYLPTVIKNIFCLVKNIIHDFEEIKRKMSQP